MTEINRTPALSMREQISFASRLSILLAAHIPILAALRMLEAHASMRSARQSAALLRRGVEDGQSLSDSMAEQRRAFSDFAVSMVRVGEQSGALHENLRYLADELAKKFELRKKILGALIYPLCVAAGALAITVILIAFIFPKIIPIFQSFHVELPWSTRALIASSRVFRSTAIWTPLLLLPLAAFWYWVRKSHTARHGLSRVLLRLPLIGAMFRDYYVSNSARALGMLLKSGMRIVPALDVAAAVSGSTAYRQHLAAAAAGAERGQKLSDIFNADDLLFPVHDVQMVAVGEASGTLSELLLYVSRLHEEDLAVRARRLTAGVEPVLIVFLGLFVSFIAVSIISPIYAITQRMQH